ncbi:hypothetical protein LTR66_016435 [Elasticomyces elasticus]|nr:hypothetical protein LTR66_016435 [Elasticomyces elasticus]
MTPILPTTYTTVTLRERPKADIIPGSTFTTDISNKTPSSDHLRDGQLLLQTLYLSLDPAMRGWLNPTRSYIPPVEIGAVMRGASVCRVLASRSSKFNKGELILTNNAGWAEYAVVADKHAEKVQDTGESLQRNAIDSLSVLGLTGLTAYFGILRVGEVKKGDTVIVSGAAGATGSVVGQIAKLKGAYVIGIAGGKDKCSWLTSELGFDEALDYKNGNFEKDFRAATKGRLIDVFFDNVGGEILDLALSRAAPFSRFVICGGISHMRIKMQGFIVFDFEKEYESARKEMAGWLREGKLKRKETIVKGGLKNAEEALVGLYKGSNTGKLLVEVAPIVEDGKAKL